ncbi:lysophospholipid acyltransferase family protein [Actinotalea sp. K2]|uniref:lysophospholipid acyltransferase family protein n=1 Tax=Actinotalea sp. K2 TaxID=2939438 RepID=UPI002016D996|nr:lysophospholipid acyltransferase family protein [Actinotalea sp. K2]MCL3862043.1 1-acyl-sn-glycerol-3-phosphate acyltransferase [Actinotalea sp. K2]
MTGATVAAPGVPGEVGPRWARWVGRFFARVVWSTEIVGAHHVPKHGPVLLAANHTGFVDGHVLIGAAPRGIHVLVKQEAFTGAIGAVLRASGQIPVDPDGGRTALVAGLAVLRRGGVVAVFPEGNRGRGDAASSRGGVAWLAVTSGAPVVPVAILGTRRTGESVDSSPGLRRRLVVEFGEPLTLTRPAGVSGRDAVAQGHETLRTTLAEHVDTVVRRTGVALPTDDPNAEQRGPVRP